MGLFMCSYFNHRVLNFSAIGLNVLLMPYKTNDKWQKYQHTRHALGA